MKITVEAELKIFCKDCERPVTAIVRRNVTGDHCIYAEPCACRAIEVFNTMYGKEVKAKNGRNT